MKRRVFNWVNRPPPSSGLAVQYSLTPLLSFVYLYSHCINSRLHPAKAHTRRPVHLLIARLLRASMFGLSLSVIVTLQLLEVFGTGTAAVISPVNGIKYRGHEIEVRGMD